MSRFFFTYGTDGQPYVGGWTEVEAPTMKAAVQAFRAIHPDRTPGLINCSDVYTEQLFELTEMFTGDNLGHRCHEIITLRCDTIAPWKGE